MAGVRGLKVRSARELGPNDWILSFFSLQHASFDERLDAAAAAGFAGIGLLLHEYKALRKSGRSDAELRSALDERGLVLAEIEALMGWGGSEPERALAALDLATACHMAEVFGARHLQAIGPFAGSIDDAARAFARACDAAAEVDLRVALEFLPPNNIPDAGVALDIVARADRPNGGLCVDNWHHFRGARDEALLRAIPGERIVAIQLSDGTREPQDSEYFRDCLQNRVPTGEGEFDLAGFMKILGECGARAPLSFEVISRELQQRSPAEAALQIAAGARRLPALES